MNFDFLGLGVSFGGRDRGLVKQEGLVSRGFLAIKDSLSGLADSSPFERMGQGLQAMTDHVGAVINQVRGLTEGVNLTTGYEAHMQALGVEARRLGANMGYAGGQLNTFTSRAAGMADSLNTSASVAAEALDAFARGGEGLRIVGIRTARDAARFQAAGLGSAEALSSQIHQLRTEYQLTDDQVREVIGSTTAMGRATGNVSAALGSLGDLMGSLRQAASLQGSQLDPAELARSAAGVQANAAAFYQMTHNADEARQMAMQIFQSQLGARENWSNMFAGTESDVSDFVTHMSIAQGDVNRSFEQMREGPAEFVRGLVQMYRTAKRNGPVTAEQFNFLRGQLERAIGPQSAQMMADFMRTADDATLDTMTNVQNATADLGRMAREAHRTGRTLQEEFQRIKDIGTASFRSIGRHEAVEMVRDTSRAFHQFNDSMRDVVARGGPMAQFVEKLSAIHQIGALALIPRTLRPMAVLFGHLTEQVAPLVTALGALGLNLSSLLNPYTLVIAAAGYLLLNFFDLFVQTHDLGTAFDKLKDRVIGFAEEAWGTLSHYTDLLLTFLDGWTARANEWAQHFAWGAFFVTWLNRALSAVGHVREWLQDLGATIFDELGAIFSGRTATTRLGRIAQNLGGIAMAMFRGLGAALSKLDWGAIAHMALFGLFDAMLGPVLGTVAVAMPWSRLGLAISKGLTDAMTFVRGGGIGEWLTDQFDHLTETVAEAWPGIEAEILRFAERVPGMLSEGINRGADFANGLLVTMREGLDGAKAWLTDHQDEVVHALSEIGARVLSAIGWVVQTALGALWTYLTRLPELYGNLGDLLESAVMGALTAIDTLMAGLLESIRGALLRAFPEYADTINSVMDTLRGFHRFMWDTVYRGIVVRLFDSFRLAIHTIADAFHYLSDTASDVAHFIEDPWGSLVRWFEQKWAELSAGWDGLIEDLKGTYHGFTDAVGRGVAYLSGLFPGVGDAFRDSLGGAIDWVSQKWESFKAAVQHGIDSISGLLRSIFGGGGETDSAVQDSVGATQVVATQARSIVQDTTQAVSGGIVTGLINAFRGGYDVVIRGLGSFRDRFLDIFTRFGTTLRDRIIGAMEEVKNAIDHLIGQIGGTVASLSSRFASLISAATTLSALTAATAPSPGTPGAQSPVGTVRPLDHQATPEDVRQAVHDPQWYRNYIQVFDARMRELIGAVERGARSQPQGGRRSESPAGVPPAVEQGVQSGR